LSLIPKKIMLKSILKIIIIFFLTILQLSIFSKFATLGAFPNIIFILAIVLALKNRREDSFLVAVVGGLVLDLASPLRFGVYTFAILDVLLLINFVVLKYLPSPGWLFTFLIMTGSFLAIDLFISLFTLTWTGWNLFFDPVINGLWGIILSLILAKVIKTQSEIQFTSNVDI